MFMVVGFGAEEGAGVAVGVGVSLMTAPVKQSHKDTVMAMIKSKTGYLLFIAATTPYAMFN
jgi:hypothetical protein